MREDMRKVIFTKLTSTSQKSLNYFILSHNHFYVSLKQTFPN
jgi:hypothetical protein